jgi:hypothetical protein
LSSSTREPQLISYEFFVDEGATQMTVIAVHPDPASLELHLDIGGRAFHKFTDFITLQTIEVYGRPSDKALEQLREKAQMLGETTDVVVHDRHAGFSRFVQPGCEASDRHRQGLVKFGVDRPTNAETSSS